jgi:beta-galactosidase beta subunit
MVLGQLNQQCINFRTLVLQKPVWRLCFNWLCEMPKDLPFGQYNLDHQIVTAVYSQLPSSEYQYKNINILDSTAQIHYLVEGSEEINLVSSERGITAQDQDGEGVSCSKKLILIQNPRDFIVLFPDEKYCGRSTALGSKLGKKVVVSIPVQRII